MGNMTTLQILQGIKTWVTTKLNLKQDVINDLANIRSGAQAGSTAVQPAELSAYFNDASYDSNAHRINFYHGQTVVAYIDASPFIIDGMVDDVRIENGYLVIDFNTASGKQDISIPLTDIFNPNNYYNKTQTDGLLAQKQDVIQDLADIRSGASAGSTAVQPSDMESAIGEAKEEIVEDVEDNYAKKDGAYETLLAGSALNLQGQRVSQNNSMYRTTAGSEDVASGIAELVSVKGNTVAWNQLIKNGNFVNKNNWEAENGTINASNNTLTYTVSKPSSSYSLVQKNFKKNTGHKFLFSCELNYSSNPKTSDGIWMGVAGYYGVKYKKTIIINQWFKFEDIITDGGTAPNNSFRIYLRTQNMNIGDTISVKNVHSFDLTLIYGEGNEPSTPEEFEADYQRWFGKPLTYEPYDAGSLRPVLMNSIKTVGFNQYNASNGLVKAIVGSQYQITGTYNSIWESDEEEVSFVSYTYGDTTEIGLRYSNGNGRYICNYTIAAYSNTSTYGVGRFVTYDGSIYKCSITITEAEEWDASKWTLVADISAMVTEGIFSAMNISLDSNGIFTPTKFYVHVEGGNNTDTCVHLVGNGAMNGEYEQYKENSVSIPITTLTGKLNGEGESVVVFPDGMKRVGSVFDEIVIKNGKAVAIKRIDGIDLGNATWNYRIGGSPSKTRFYTTAIRNKVVISNETILPKLLNVKYLVESPRDAYYAENSEKLMTMAIQYFWNVANEYGSIIVQDSTYSTAADLKTSLSGVMLYYVLKTPEEYILDDFQLPIRIQVDALGTEEQITPSDVASAPATIGIKYVIDAVGFIINAPKDYISEASMDNFLSRLGTAMGGTWSKTWNAESEQYDFSFTPSVQQTTNEEGE